MAYAAIVSLKSTIERLIIPSNPQLIKLEFEQTVLSLVFTLRRLDDSSNININRSVISSLDAEIREAVCKLEDVFEDPYLGPDQKGVEQQIDSFLKTVRRLEKEYITELINPNPLPQEEEEEENAVVFPVNVSGGDKPTTVGLSDQFEQIRNEVLNWESGLETVSLVGMAGIGKTHLAALLYHHPLIVQHFDFTFWVSLGPKYKKDDIFVDIVAQIEHKPRELYVGDKFVTLITILKKRLLGRRYLIVLDDNWSTKVCDTLLFWLPPNGSGRRFLLTTRREGVAKHHKTSIHHIRFLNNEESWNLLRQNVFGDEYFPSQLEKPGRKIAEMCEGLPLLILAVADILRGLEKTEEYWKKVADKKTTTFTDAYDRILKVLYSSYEYLPHHLKACFLYMGVFPQSSEIRLQKLVNLWTVEDVLESKGSQTVGDLAVECMKGLIANSIAILCKHSSNNGIKSSKLHSAYWHLCVKEARKTKFCHVLNKLTDASRDFIERQRRLSIQNNVLFGIKEVYDLMAAASRTRSLLCTGKDHEYPVPICFNLMMLKVLDALSVRFYEFPMEVVKLLQLRYLALTHYGKLPSSISKLQQLQCLILRRHHNIKLVRDSDLTCLPREIWDMKELRHLWIVGNNLPYPTSRLPNLSTLDVNAYSCTVAVFQSIPKLKKLGIKIESQPGAAETLTFFEHIRILDGLESLKCVVVNPRVRPQVVAPPQQLPFSLKKLCLNGLGYSWECMSVIGALKFLKVLKLRCSAIRGAEWETKVTDFQSLEFLLLEDIDLVHWTINDDTSRNDSFEIDIFNQLQWTNRYDPLELDDLVLRTITDDPDELDDGSNELDGIDLMLRTINDDSSNELDGIDLVLRTNRYDPLELDDLVRRTITDDPDELDDGSNELDGIDLVHRTINDDSSNELDGIDLVLRTNRYDYDPLELVDGSIEPPYGIDLMHRTINDIDPDEHGQKCFQRLQRLIIRHCYKLKQIPPQIGRIPALKMMEIIDCSPSVVASAQQIHKKENYSFQLVMESSWNFR